MNCFITEEKSLGLVDKLPDIVHLAEYLIQDEY